tara:strand:- start:98 stop:1474 length:1377 start_codon:yes stop_codon:yes gene_type:complete
MAINFPSSKNVNDIHTVGNKSWIWDGVTWKIYSSSASGIGLSDLSVNTASAGTAALSYNQSTGVFTYTPPDLSSYITQQYTLPTASTTVLGGVKVDGSSINIDANGVISGASTYTLPTASTTVLGGVKVDGTTITINNGVISGASSVPTSITVVNENTDVTCFPLFTTDATGDLAPKTVTSFKLNSQSGQIEAGSFKMTGGTSSEFLKADGSIDSSTYSTFSGSYTDLTNKPTLFSGSYNDLSNKPTLFSGSYTDLTNKPTIPTATSQLTNDSGFITSGGGSSRTYILDNVSMSGWGNSHTVTGIPTSSTTSSYKRITILLQQVAFSNAAPVQLRLRVGTSNNGIVNQYYGSVSTDGAGNTYTSDDCFIIGRASTNSGPLLSGVITLDRLGDTIIEHHSIIECDIGTPSNNKAFVGSGHQVVFQSDNFDRVEFSVIQASTPPPTAVISFGKISMYAEF